MRAHCKVRAPGRAVSDASGPHEVPGEGFEPITPSRAGGFKPPASTVPPPGLYALVGRGYATRAAGSAVTSAGPGTDASSAARIRPVSAGGTWFATSTPSTMSATTAANGRSRSRTDTTAPPGYRRMVRVTPGVPAADSGRPAPRGRSAWAAAPRRRATSAKRSGGASWVTAGRSRPPGARGSGYLHPVQYRAGVCHSTRSVR